MQRSEAEHVLRAAAAIAQEQSFVVVGSQALLFILPHVPEALLVSRELDLYPVLHPSVGPETAVMPADWMERATLHYVGELTAICPDLHDLVVSKCVAARQKDADFVRELLRHELVSAVTLHERVAMLDAAKHPLAHILAWIDRRQIEAKATP